MNNPLNSPRRGFYATVALLALVLGAGTLLARRSERPTWEADIRPLFDGRCLVCHSDEAALDYVVLEDYDDYCGGDDPPARPGDLTSPLMRVLMMPPADGELDHRVYVDEERLRLIAAWIMAGCPRD